MTNSESPMHTLYVVATPIGNLEDVTIRALRILREVDLIAAEDTRKTMRLLAVHDIKTRLTSYHEHSADKKLDYILSQLKEKDVALVSEAGMPGLSDPGYELIKAAIQRGIPVVPVPGASAITTALVISGLPSEQFAYVGFLPRRSGDRRRLLQSIVAVSHVIVAFESPHRLQAALNDLLEVFGDREIAVCRELTKIHEEVFRGRISEAIEYFTEPRGEFTLVIDGGHVSRGLDSFREVEEGLRSMWGEGIPAKQAIAEMAAVTGLSRNELYKVWLRICQE